MSGETVTVDNISLRVADFELADNLSSVLVDTGTIKTKTDGLNFTGEDVMATLDSEEVVTDSASRTASKATGFATPTNVTDAHATTDALVNAIEGGVAGSGAISTTITCKIGELPVDGVEVWVSTDEAGGNVVAGTLVSDVNGQVVFTLDAADYYVWRQLAGANFSNPKEITVE